jgi:hypothetical protein
MDMSSDFLSADFHGLAQINVAGSLCQTPGVSQGRPTVPECLISVTPIPNCGGADSVNSYIYK